MQAILEHGNLPPEEAEKFVALLSSEFAELRGNAATKEDVTVLGGEMREGFAQEMREGFARVDTEMREGFARLTRTYAKCDAAERHAAILEHLAHRDATMQSELAAMREDTLKRDRLMREEMHRRDERMLRAMSERDEQMRDEMRERDASDAREAARKDGELRDAKMSQMIAETEVRIGRLVIMGTGLGACLSSGVAVARRVGG